VLIYPDCVWFGVIFIFDTENQPYKCMRHVAVCLPDFSGGGAESAAIQVANGLAMRGHSVELVVLSTKGPCREQIMPRVKIVNLGITRARYALCGFVRYLRSAKPEILISNLMDVPVMLAKLITCSKAVVILCEHAHFSTRRNNTRNFNRKLWGWLSRLLYPFADKIVAVSGASANDLVDMGIVPRDKMCVIYNPVIPSNLQALQKEKPAIAWFVEENAPVVLAVGRLEPPKDYETLLRAFALLRNQRLRLVVLGEGAERAKLEDLVRVLGLESRVLFPGFVKNPYACMVRAALFVHSSCYEGGPSVLMEAMACGVTPVVTDAPGGIREILGDGFRDYLVPVGDILALAAAMERALVKPYTPAALRERARLFSEEASIDAYEKLIGELLAEK